MHNAPSVSYPVGRSRWVAAMLLMTWTLGASAVALWCLQVQPPAWRALPALALVLVSGVAAGWAWARTAHGTLAWDGESWSWSGQRAAGGSLDVALDFQRILLVRWRGPSAGSWLWLEKSALPARWDDLRRAVYSRARPQALPGAQPPGAKP